MSYFEVSTLMCHGRGMCVSCTRRGTYMSWPAHKYVCMYERRRSAGGLSFDGVDLARMCTCLNVQYSTLKVCARLDVVWDNVTLCDVV